MIVEWVLFGFRSLMTPWPNKFMLSELESVELAWTRPFTFVLLPVLFVL